MKYEITLMLILIVIAIVLWFCTSCTSTALKQITTLEYNLNDPNEVKETRYTAFSHHEFLMQSEMDNAEVVIDGQYRHYAIGKRVQIPDSNSIEALTPALLEFLRLWGLQ